MKLISIENRLAKGDPAIRVYDNRCVLNASACSLLDVAACMKIHIRIDADITGKGRLYVRCMDRPGGYDVKLRGHTGYINSTSASMYLSQMLSGPGVYRICHEVTEKDDSDGGTWYEIFFRRYDY